MVVSLITICPCNAQGNLSLQDIKSYVDDTLENLLQTIQSMSLGSSFKQEIGIYIENNTTWEFSKDYDTTAVLIFRNRILQPIELYSTIDISSKTRVVFSNTINASDEVLLISSK